MVGPPCRRTRPPLFSARHSGMDMGKKGWAGGKKDSRLKDTGNGLAASGECQLYRTGTAPSNLAGGQAEIGIMYSHFSPFLEWKREKRGPLPPPAAFPRMGGAWGKNTFFNTEGTEGARQAGRARRGGRGGGGVRRFAPALRRRRGLRGRKCPVGHPLPLHFPCDVAGSPGFQSGEPPRFPCLRFLRSLQADRGPGSSKRRSNISITHL